LLYDNIILLLLYNYIVMGEISLKILCKNGIEKLCLSLLLLWAIVLVIRSKSKIILDDHKYLFLFIFFIIFF